MTAPPPHPPRPPRRPQWLAGVFLWCAVAVQAQSDVKLDRLVFDAYPLPAAGLDEAEPAAPGFRPGARMTPPVADRIASDDSGDEIDIDEARATVEHYLDQLASTSDQQRPFDRELFEQQLALGLGYQDAGDHEKAIEAFEQAEYLSRINNGLYSPQQFPVIERMIDSYLATGDLQTAWQRRQYLYYLTSQYYGEDSLEVVPVLTSLADWNMASFDGALKAGNNVGFVAGGGPGGTRSLTPRGRAFPLLFAAQSQYYHAIMNLVSHRRVPLDQLMTLEMNLVEAVFLSAHRLGILEDPAFYMEQRVMRTGSRLRRGELNGNSISFRNGVNSFERMRIYQNLATSVTPVERIQPLLGLGDWNLLFNRRPGALEHYQEAAMLMREAGVPQAEIDAVLEPEVPVQLPWFAPRPNSRRQFGIPEDAPLDYDGWIDVTFRVSRYGSVSRVTVLDTSEGVTPEIERRLRRVLRHGPFRPRLSALENGESEDISLRYHFAVL